MSGLTAYLHSQSIVDLSVAWHWRFCIPNVIGVYRMPRALTHETASVTLKMSN